MKDFNYSEIEKKVEDLDRDMESLIKNIERKRNELKTDLEDSFQGIITSKLNKEYLKEFAKKPYAIIPNYRKDNEWIIAVPKFIDFSLGWLERSDEAWNYFTVNRYFNWLAKIPKELQEKFNFKEPIPLKVFDGVVLTGEKHQEEAWKRYGRYLSKREGKDRIIIKRGYEFRLIADMIDDGILPFMPKPVVKEDLLDTKMKYKLRDYQQDAWNKFLEMGAIGVYHPFGSGKTCIGLWALGHVRVNDLPNLVIVPTKTLKEQWIIRIDKYIPDLKYDIEIETYNVYERLKNKEFGLVVFDECHRLPANTFSKLSTIPIKYRIGLSATPYREDGRTDFIFALTGFPVGLDWSKLLEMNIVKKPTVYLYIVDSRQDKVRKLNELLKVPKKTLIFCDSIEFGEKLSKQFEIPFVYGSTTNRLQILEDAETSIVSRVGDEGVSLPALERVIEIDFLFGSRRQEGQRMGRLFHAEKKGEHIILMTEEEFENYEKRLYAIYEKGFKIEVIR